MKGEKSLFLFGIVELSILNKRIILKNSVDYINVIWLNLLNIIYVKNQNYLCFYTIFYTIIIILMFSIRCDWKTIFHNVGEQLKNEMLQEVISAGISV